MSLTPQLNLEIGDSLKDLLKNKLVDRGRFRTYCISDAPNRSHDAFREEWRERRASLLLSPKEVGAIL